MENKTRKLPTIPERIKLYFLENQDRILEFYRMRFHTYVVTASMVFNLFVIIPSVILSLISIIQSISIPPFYIRFDTIPIGWVIFFFNLPLLTWLYSTITQPIYKGYTPIIDWRLTKKGRLRAAILNGIPFVLMFWILTARYVKEHYSPYLSSIQVDHASYLLVTDLHSFIIFLYLFPLFLIGSGIFVLVRHIMKYEDLKEQFFKWEFGLFASQSFSLLDKSADVIVGWEEKTNKPIVIKENSRYLHELVCGATGSGKTSTTIMIRMAQDLIRIAKGHKMGVILLEPKGDAVLDVLELCEKLGVPKEKIKVVDPTNEELSVKFNPFFGPLDSAAENFRGVLDSLTPDQDEFFKGQQNETAALFTMLAKLRFNEFANISHLQQMYTDPRYLASMTEQVREHINKWRMEKSVTEETLERYERIVSYFEDEVLDYKTYRDRDGQTVNMVYPPGHRYAGQQQVENKKDKYVTGAKKYLNDISMNALLSNMMVAKGDDTTLDMDLFLEEGGVLLINTSLAELQELSLMLGQFVIRQLQSAIFRRPREEDGYKRCPVFLTVDEFPLYANPSFERLLTLGRSYKVGTLIAIQSLSQLDKIETGYKQTIMANASSKTVFGRGVHEDNELFSNEFGEEIQVEESLNESLTPVTTPSTSWGFRHNTQRKMLPRYTPTEIRELPFKHMIVQVVEEDGSIGYPKRAYGQFINETTFLSRFIKFKDLKLRTTNSEELDITNAVTKLKEGIITHEEAPKEDQTIDEVEERDPEIEEKIITVKPLKKEEQIESIEWRVTDIQEQNEGELMIEEAGNFPPIINEIDRELQTNMTLSPEMDTAVDELTDAYAKKLEETKEEQKVETKVKKNSLNNGVEEVLDSFQDEL